MLFLLGSIFVGWCYVGIPTASMVENDGNFYLAFMVKHTVSIDPASMLRHDIFTLLSQIFCTPAFYGQTCLFYHAFIMLITMLLFSGQQVSGFCFIYSYLILLLSFIITKTLFVIWYLNVVIYSVTDIRKSISLFDLVIWYDNCIMEQKRADL